MKQLGAQLMKHFYNILVKVAVLIIDDISLTQVLDEFIEFCIETKVLTDIEEEQQMFESNNMPSEGRGSTFMVNSFLGGGLGKSAHDGPCP